MSRIPRDQEHMKTSFTAEAVSAARFRAYAAQAEADGLPSLAERWRRLAHEKDRLAIAGLVAAGQVRGTAADVRSALGEERFENDVLYPKLIDEVDRETADLFLTAVARQKDHIRELSALRDEVQGAHGDVDLPPEVEDAEPRAETG